MRHQTLSMPTTLILIKEAFVTNYFSHYIDRKTNLNMACHHKFIDDLTLDKLDFEPTTLIVGTFNPGWSCLSNHAEWFYGRTDNNYFWDVLPRLYDEKSLINGKAADWKAFCKRHQIAITDLISCIEDANIINAQHVNDLKTYSDAKIASNFNIHSTVSVVNLLKRQLSIKNIYLTKGANEVFWKNLWTPIKEHSISNKLYATTLLTPSGYAFYQQGRYNKKNQNNQLNLPEFILKSWKERWHF